MNEGIVDSRPGEVVLDEDFLSYDLRASLEQVGSATGFILAGMLLFGLLPRAGRLLALVVAPPAGEVVMPSEDRDARAIERRALEAPSNPGAP